jgi:hypothetical protein
MDRAMNHDSTTTIKVFGNYGSLEVELPTGNVRRYDWCPDDDGDGTEYADIVRFDLPSYETHFGRTFTAGVSVDIIDLAFWSDTGEYHDPGWPKNGRDEPQPDFVRPYLRESVA